MFSILGFSYIYLLHCIGRRINACKFEIKVILFSNFIVESLWNVLFSAIRSPLIKLNTSLNNALISHCVPYLYVLSVTVLTLWVAPLKWSAVGIGFNGTKTNCGIARILGILLMNTVGHVDVFFSNYYNLQSVHFECKVWHHAKI